MTAKGEESFWEIPVKHIECDKCHRDIIPLKGFKREGQSGWAEYPYCPECRRNPYSDNRIRFL